MEYRDCIVPRDVYCVEGDSSSVGSLTAASLTYSEDEVVVLSPPKRWNCDAGLEPKVRQKNSNVFIPPATLPASHGRFRDPEFFPPFVSMKSSQLSGLESYDDDDEAEHDSDVKRRFSCNIFGNNNISTHARMEMLRHQMSKPFRALPFPTTPKIDTSCIGKSVLQSVVANQLHSTSALDFKKSRKLARWGQRGNSDESVDKTRCNPANDRGNPFDEERDQKAPRTQSKKHSPLREKHAHCNALSPFSSRSLDYSIDKAELSFSNDTHWLSLVATDESSVEEFEVVLKLDLD